MGVRDEREPRVLTEQRRHPIRLFRRVAGPRFDDHDLPWNAEPDQHIANGFGFASAELLGVGEPAGGNHHRRVQQAIEPRPLDGVEGSAARQAFDGEPLGTGS